MEHGWNVIVIDYMVEGIKIVNRMDMIDDKLKALQLMQGKGRLSLE